MMQISDDKSFTVDKISCLIKHVQYDATFINVQQLHFFLNKNFFRMMNGEYFLEFPIEVVTYILSLDLAIESEYQVFQAILKWVKHDESRIKHLPELLKCLRWCSMLRNCYMKIREDEFIVKYLWGLDELACAPGDCCNSCLNSRVKEKKLFSISFKNNCIGISLYVEDKCWKPCGIFKEDDRIPVDIIHPEHVADFIFDSGRCGLRIDFVDFKYRWLEMSGSANAYYNQLYTCFKPKFDRESSYRAFIQDEVKENDDCIDLEKNTFIEDNGVMNIICYPQKDSRLFCFLPAEHIDWFNKPFADAKVHATVLNGIYYIITETLTFRIFDSVKKTIEKSTPFEGMDLAFDDLQLVSHKTNVILLIKSQSKLMMFDTRKKIWSCMRQILTEYPCQKMIALSTSDISVKFIKRVNKTWELEQNWW